MVPFRCKSSGPFLPQIRWSLCGATQMVPCECKLTLNNSANQLNSSIKELELSQQRLNKLYVDLNLDKSSWRQFVTEATTNQQAILNWEARSKEIQQILARQQQLLRGQQVEIEIFNKSLNESGRTGLTTRTSHTTVQAISHTAVSTKHLTASPIYLLER